MTDLFERLGDGEEVERVYAEAGKRNARVGSAADRGMMGRNGRGMLQEVQNVGMGMCRMKAGVFEGGVAVAVGERRDGIRAMRRGVTFHSEVDADSRQQIQSAAAEQIDVLSGGQHPLALCGARGLEAQCRGKG